jgi:hypothetical protein
MALESVSSWSKGRHLRMLRSVLRSGLATTDKSDIARCVRCHFPSMMISKLQFRTSKRFMLEADEANSAEGRMRSFGQDLHAAFKEKVWRMDEHRLRCGSISRMN